jgi:RNA polymerase sigma factor (TIGR02999 family)
MAANAPITELIAEVRAGTPEAWDRLLAEVYDELRRIAHRHLRRERAGHTLNTTAVVHEAYLRLANQAQIGIADRRHFFAVASRAMRHVLVDHARRYCAAKRGGRCRHVRLDEADVAVEERAEALLALDEALGRLTALDERLGRVVECRYFGGLTEEETGEALGMTARTVRRDWVKARLWLYDQLREVQT